MNLVHVDLTRPGLGLVTFVGANRSGTVVEQGGYWLAEEGEAGMVVGPDLPTARTPEEAVRVIADHYGLPADLDIHVHAEYEDEAED